MKLGRYEHEHSKYIALSLLPLQAILSYLFFYRRYNFAECITFWLFCVGFINTLLILLTPLRLLLINQKDTVDFILRLLIIFFYLWHTFALFGNNIINKIKCVLLILIVSVINLYIILAFLSTIATPYHPGLWDSLRIIFTNVSPTYIHGVWKLE